MGKKQHVDWTSGSIMSAGSERVSLLNKDVSLRLCLWWVTTALYLSLSVHSSFLSARLFLDRALAFKSNFTQGQFQIFSLVPSSWCSLNTTGWKRKWSPPAYLILEFFWFFSRLLYNPLEYCKRSSAHIILILLLAHFWIQSVGKVEFLVMKIVFFQSHLLESLSILIPDLFSYL